MLLGLLLVSVAGLRPVGIDNDSAVYAELISDVAAVQETSGKEPAFVLLVWLNSQLFGGDTTTFFLIFAVLGVGLKLLALRRQALFPLDSVLLYICLYFVLHEMTQIRAGVAAGILLLAMPDIMQRNSRAFLAKLLLAMCFHYSAVFMAPLYFLSTTRLNRIAYLLLPALGLMASLFVSLDLILSVLSPVLPGPVTGMLTHYQTAMSMNETSAATPLNVYFGSLWFFYTIGVFSLSGAGRPQDILLIKVLGVGLAAFYSLLQFPVAAFRVAEMLGIVALIVLPNIAERFRNGWIYRFFLALWAVVFFGAVMVPQNLDFS